MAENFQTLLVIANVVALLMGVFFNFRRQEREEESEAKKVDFDAHQILSEDYKRILEERNDLMIKLDKCAQEKEYLQDLLSKRSRGRSAS